ncbi:MAG: MptD family putative ECF transporter S component [Bifidobacterium breve]|nr:MptD family putative ECF transporter S component [Bifidobacterium breve]MCC4093562.1 MptD family putative ECF transporter S component [Bifidobacterium breve]
MTAPNTPAETSDQPSKPANSGKLEVSDLITIGIFAALYFVMVCIATLVSTLLPAASAPSSCLPLQPSSPAACTCCWPRDSASSAASPSWA